MVNNKNNCLKVIRNNEGKITATVRKLWLLEFIKKVYAIYGFYLDCQYGFSLLNTKMEKFQKIFSQNSKIPIEELDKRSFIYGEGEPGKRGSYKKHVSEQEKVKARNKKDGENYKISANLCIVLIYQYWEDVYREKIAICDYGYNCKNDLKLDIFQDIRMIRQSIIHNNSIACKDVEKNKYIKWFKRGDKIDFSTKQFDKVMNFIFYSIFNTLPERYKKYFPQLYGE